MEIKTFFSDIRNEIVNAKSVDILIKINKRIGGFVSDVSRSVSKPVKKELYREYKLTKKLMNKVKKKF